MRGARGTAVGSASAEAVVRRVARRPPGNNSRTVSTSARKPAQVIQSMPRSSGSRDCGKAGYGCAPVKRRRRPVTDGGVGARFVESLIDHSRRQRVVARAIDDARGTTSMTTTVPRRAREQEEPTGAKSAAAGHSVRVGEEVADDPHVAAGIGREIEDLVAPLV